MPTEDVRRFAREEISGTDLVVAYPQCACELTEPFDGGHGPIKNEERLSFFVESKRHINLSNEDQRKRKDWSPKGSDLRNATEGRGHSVYRLDYASPAELRQGAEAGYRSATGQSTDDWRGIFGIFVFKAEVARLEAPDGYGKMCVVDTPQLASDDKTVSEFSHADLLWSDARKDTDDNFVLKRRKFEDYMRVVFSKNGSFESLRDFAQADLTDFLPDCLKTA